MVVTGVRVVVPAPGVPLGRHRRRHSIDSFLSEKKRPPGRWGRLLLLYGVSFCDVFAIFLF